MINEHAEQLRLAAENYGLRPSRAHVCPRVVAGKRCLSYHEEPCLCQKHHSLLDHGRVWLDRQGRRVVTGEPYHVAKADLVDLAADMATLGLRVTVKPQSESFWYPGHTHLIFITRDDVPVRRKPDPAGVTWKTIEETITSRWNGRISYRSRSRRHYEVPSPTGGHLTVEVTLKPRWCALALDRWRTTDREPEVAKEWLEEHVWPIVTRAHDRKKTGSGFLPGGGATFSSAEPIERPDLLEVIVAWVGAELTWGQPKDAVRRVEP